MVPRLHPRGKSFKGASVYLLHDKQQGQTLGTSFKGAVNYLLHDKGGQTSERVAWTHGANLFSDRPEDAWFEMMDTWRDRQALKRAAGIKATGRDNKAPVLHMSLSWHPDEMPSAEHMKETALSAIKALGLQEHQALLVAHKDEPHPHVHLLVNTVHPVTGKTADLKRSKETLSRWAEAYEREHGRIYCEERVKNNARRQQLREERSATKQRGDFAKAAGRPAPPEKPYEPVKDNSPSRWQWFEKQDIVDRMKALRAEKTAEQKPERDTLWLKHQAERAQIERATESRVDIVRKNVQDLYRPKWREIYRAQTAEKRFLAREATHPFARACYVFANRDRLAAPGKRLSVRDMASLILSPRRLGKRVEAVHERERRTVAQSQKTQQKTLTDRAWAAHRATWHQTTERQAVERKAMQAHHRNERAEIGFAQAKADLAAERAQPPQGRAAETFSQAQQAVPAPAPSPAQESRAAKVARQLREIQDMQKRRGGRDTFERER